MAGSSAADTAELAERELLLAFRNGDVDAFEALFRLHQRAVFAWILRIVRNVATADELTVETFWRIHQAHARFDPARGFEGWVRRIATNAALDWMRRSKRERALTGEMDMEPAAAAVGDAAVAAEVRRKTTLAFELLPPKLRLVAVLAVVEEYPQKEIAEALGISVAAVKLRVFRAMRILRKSLEKQGMKP